MSDATAALRGCRLALRGMLDSHLDRCRDDRNEVCSACVLALLAVKEADAILDPPRVRQMPGEGR